MKTRNERQAHGFFLENMLAENMKNIVIYGEDAYTAPEDGEYLLSESNSFPLSVKNTRYGGEICLGSFKRIISNDSSMLMINGFHRPKETFDRLIVSYLPYGFMPFFYNRENEVSDFVAEFTDYMSMDGDFDYDDYEFTLGEFVNELNDHGADTYWRKDRTEFKRRYEAIFIDGFSSPLISPRPKRDHKKQHRLQCAIPRRYLQRFFDSEFNEIIIDTDEFDFSPGKYSNREYIDGTIHDFFTC